MESATQLSCTVKRAADCASRDDLAARAVGVAVELGVAAGEFSATILDRSCVTMLFSIDRWCDHHDESEYLQASRRLSRFGVRSQLVHAKFEVAVAQFEDRFFDFIYIDGYAHMAQDNGRTLRDWWPKLKPGGIFSGHDYDVHQYPDNVAVVDAFAKQHGLGILLTGESELPSWFVTKPNALP